jgi:uncharacterized membrane protein YraQ (UPF0718 family)
MKRGVVKQKRLFLKWLLHGSLLCGYAVFLGASYWWGFEPGKQAAQNCLTFSRTMLSMMPMVFVLIGLFDVWISRDTVERHLGPESGPAGYVWAVLLAGTVMGPLYVALPVAYALCQKGARLGVIFTYIGAATICRVPMTVFEATFLGVKFTLVRFIVSLPLVISTSVLLEKYLTARGYTLAEPK